MVSILKHAISLAKAKDIVWVAFYYSISFELFIIKILLYVEKQNIYICVKYNIKYIQVKEYGPSCWRLITHFVFVLHNYEYNYVLKPFFRCLTFQCGFVECVGRVKQNVAQLFNAEQKRLNDSKKYGSV